MSGDDLEIHARARGDARAPVTVALTGEHDEYRRLLVDITNDEVSALVAVDTLVRAIVSATQTIGRLTGCEDGGMHAWQNYVLHQVQFHDGAS